MTPRLDFLPLVPAHAAGLFPALSPPEIYTYMPEEPPPDEAALWRSIDALVNGPPPTPATVGLNWAIHLRGEGRLVGALQATRYDDGKVWIGYKLGPEHWGRGLATEAVRWLVGELPRHLGPCDLYAAVDTRNPASARVLEKVGFLRLSEEETLLRGERALEWIYALPGDLDGPVR